MKSKHIIFIMLAMSFNSISFARDCRSELGAFFKPIYKNAPILWALELSTTYGEMNSNDLDRNYNNQHLFFGMDINLGRNRIYFEPALKYWKRSDPPSKTKLNNETQYPLPKKKNLGIRELFISRQLNNGNLTLGLQSMEYSGSSILDERALGVSLDKTFGALDLDIKFGTVSRDFGRMEDFCGTRHVYRIIKQGPFSLLGNQPGETNFASGKIIWTPGKKISKSESTKTNNEFDEFNEFNEFDEFSAIGVEKQKLISNMGFMFIKEFGNGFPESKYYFGPSLSLTLPFLFELENELIYQYVPEEQNLAYIAKLNRNFNWNSGALTQVSLNYYGAFGIDEGSRFYPTFSSLFIGEVMRLDAMHMPLIQLSVKQKMPIPLHPSMKIAYMQQTEQNHTSELDVHLSLQVFKGLKVYGIYSIIKSDELNDDVNMSKLELRWAF